MKKDNNNQQIHPLPQSALPDVPEAHPTETLPEMESRFADAHTGITYPGEPAQTHCHPYHELICCVTGSGDYQVGNQRFHLNRGDIFSIPVNCFHSFSASEPLTEPYRRYILRLSPEFLQLLQSAFLPTDTPAVVTPFVLNTAGTMWEPLSDLFRRCVLECEQHQFRWETVVFGIAIELSVQIARAWMGRQESAQEKPELLDRIMTHVEGHLSEKITLQDIAARFWVSQSTVSQLFRKKLGLSFYRYVIMRRLSEAQVLIRNGLPMDQVSIAVGFQDYSTFYRAFKSEYGISPAQYRKDH